MTECIREWRKIDGFDGYEVSQDGVVRSIPRSIVWKRRGKDELRTYVGRILEPSITRNGYFEVQLSAGSRITHKLIHRLVAEAFLPRIKGKNEVNHRSGDKSDNSSDNLEWMTAAENHIHRARILGIGSCENHYNARLTSAQVVTIRNAVEEGSTQLSMAKRFNVSPQQIHRIVRGKSWAIPK